MKTVLVTGGMRRIGAAIAARLRAGGWRVLLHSRAGVPAGHQYAGDVLAADFAGDPLAPARLFQEACDREPGLCAIVNNAAEFSTAAELGEAERARMMRVNAEAPEKLATLLGLRLMEHEPFAGAVVNLLDARVLPLGAGGAGDTPYAASKRALGRSTLKLAGLFAGSMRVNAVAPGPVLAPEAADAKEPGGEVLLPRRPEPDDVARAVEFLLEAEGVTGQILAVDSGQSLAARIEAEGAGR